MATGSAATWAAARGLHYVSDPERRVPPLSLPGLAPWRAENVRPQRGHGGAPVGVQRRIDARVRGPGQPDLVLQPPIVAIGVRRGRRQQDGNEAELAGDPQQRDVAQVAALVRGVLRI